jgi:hypothetical protein
MAKLTDEQLDLLRVSWDSSLANWSIIVDLLDTIDCLKVRIRNEQSIVDELQLQLKNALTPARAHGGTEAPMADSARDRAEKIYEAVARRNVGCREEDADLPERLILELWTQAQALMREKIGQGFDNLHWKLKSNEEAAKCARVMPLDPLPVHGESVQGEPAGERPVEVMPDGSMRTLTRKEEAKWRKGLKTKIRDKLAGEGQEVKK